MEQALSLAHRAEAQGEVPVGAVLVKDNELLAEGWNQPIATCDPTAHAEIIALRAGGKQLKNYRLVDTTLYVTLEPCLMCFTALVHARVARLVYGACDPKSGALSCGSQCLSLFNHTVVCSEGPLSLEAGQLLKDFFASRR